MIRPKGYRSRAITCIGGKRKLLCISCGQYCCIADLLWHLPLPGLPIHFPSSIWLPLHFRLNLHQREDILIWIGTISPWPKLLLSWLVVNMMMSRYKIYLLGRWGCHQWWGWTCPLRRAPLRTAYTRSSVAGPACRRPLRRTFSVDYHERGEVDNVDEDKFEEKENERVGLKKSIDWREHCDNLVIHRIGHLYSSKAWYCGSHIRQGCLQVDQWLKLSFVQRRFLTIFFHLWCCSKAQRSNHFHRKLFKIVTWATTRDTSCAGLITSTWV